MLRKVRILYQLVIILTPIEERANDISKEPVAAIIVLIIY